MQPIATYRTERGRLALMYRDGSKLRVKIYGGVWSVRPGKPWRSWRDGFTPEASKSVRRFVLPKAGWLDAEKRVWGRRWRRRPAGA